MNISLEETINAVDNSKKRGRPRKTQLVAEEAKISPEVKTPPELLMEGSFALYATPSGGMHLAYRLKDDEEDKHMEIPPMLVSMAAQMQGGSLNPVTMFKSMFGNKGE